jgi:putative ABC transport system permease protein
MTLFRLSWRNLLAHPLSSFLCLLLLALGVGLISFLLLLGRELEQKLTRNAAGIDLVVGAKGSPLQLILSSVFQLDAPTGNIPLAEARPLMEHPLVNQAIPLAYGDSHRGFRIVGTRPSYPAHYGAQVAEGRLWEAPFEVTLGATVAQRLSLRPGDHFHGTHGLLEGGHVHEEEAYRVVGVLQPSRTVVDQLILTSLESVWNLHAHEGDAPALPLVPAPHPVSRTAPNHPEQEGHGPAGHLHGQEEEEPAHEHDRPAGTAAAEAGQEITALLLSFRSPMAVLQLPRQINERTSLQAALPAIELNRLLSLLGFSIEALQAIALVIMLVAGVSVFVSLYNSLQERRYELAILRTLGASPSTLFGMVLLEALLLLSGGAAAGLLLSRLGLWLLGGYVAEQYHYDLSAGGLLREEVWLLLLTLAIGLVAALLPAGQALRTNISKTLADG